MAMLTVARLVEVFLAAATALAIAGCGTATPVHNNGPDSRLDGAWHLVAAYDSDGVIVLADTYITLTISRGNAAIGMSTCSDYSARIIGQPGAIFVDITRRVNRRCSQQPNISTDNRYLAALVASRFASVTTTELTLSSPRTTLRFERARPVDEASIEDISWAVTSQGFSQPGDAVNTVARYGGFLLSSSHRFELNVGGCPQVKGDWRANAGLVILSAIENRSAECPDNADAVMRDDLLFTLLDGVAPTVTSHSLRLDNVRSLSVLNLTSEF
jgi:heat shock protein HslJ